MVQRKAPPKISPQAETKRSSHVGLERQQDDLKKMKKMKLERSIRAADLESLQDSPTKQQPNKRSPARGSPNYMKPTSSSVAKKEQLKVMTPSSKTATDKITSPSPGLRLSKSLSRQSSLKGIRPLIKKSLMKGVVVNRATCSSTLKDSKFPELLDLNPGGTEADGISMMRVCPYHYCSLNGHRDEALIPLKCFMSARRKLIKTQKSMKLRGVSSIRPEVVGKDKEEVDTGQRAESKDCSDDFFVEIYAARSPEELIKDEESRAEDETEEPHGLEEDEELWDEEVDAMMSTHEFMEGDQQVEDAEEEKALEIVSEEKGDEGVGGESKAEIFDVDLEEAEIPFPDNVTECSECPDDCSGLMPPQADCCVEPDAAEADAACEELVADGEADAEFKQEVDRQGAEMNDGVAPRGGNLEGNDSEEHEGEELCWADVADQISKPERPETSGDNDGACDNSNSKEDISETMVSEESEDDYEAGQTLLKHNDNESSIFDPDGPEEQQNLREENVTGEESEDQFEDILIKEDDHMRNQEETILDCDDATEGASIPFDAHSCSSHDQSETSNITESWDSDSEQQNEVSPVEGSIAQSNARIRIGRRKMEEETDAIREFNPRSPRFLDIEPDPEAEKVDLRHQEMDERMNTEEYLLDYALRQAVMKLAPARKRKVALLVEAFETVLPAPVPVREKPSRRSTPGFNHARIMQACI